MEGQDNPVTAVKEIRNQPPKEDWASSSNQEIIKQQIRSSNRNVIIGGIFSCLAACVSTIGLIIVNHHSGEIENSKQAIEGLKNKFLNSQIFANEIEGSMPSLAGKDDHVRARMEIIRLYALTLHESDNQDKCALLDMVVASRNSELEEALANALQPKDFIKKDEHCQSALMQARSNLNELYLTKNEAINNLLDNPETAILKKLLNEHSSIPLGNTTGWLYLGKEYNSSKRLDNNSNIRDGSLLSIDGNLLGKCVQTDKDVNFLTDEPNTNAPSGSNLNAYKSGKINGIVSLDAKLKVEGSPIKFPIAPGYKADWIEVSQPSKTNPCSN